MVYNCPWQRQGISYPHLQSCSTIYCSTAIAAFVPARASTPCASSDMLHVSEFVSGKAGHRRDVGAAL